MKGDFTKNFGRSVVFKIIMVLISLAFSGAAFVGIDYLYSSVLRRLNDRKLKTLVVDPGNCQVRDAVRHHAFRPNCVAYHPWGNDSYYTFTNSLGFRDQQIRQVPLADTRPRLLMLGDSFTEGKSAWPDSFVGKIAAHFPQYDFLNGGLESYSPSNYLNVARMVLAAGVQVDDVITFIDISDTQDEAAYYRSMGASGAVAGPASTRFYDSWYSRLRLRIQLRLVLTNYLFECFERTLVLHGHYSLVGAAGNVFDFERSAWTYRKVSDTEPYSNGYAPLGVEGGIATEKAKMTVLWQELANRHIPISVVVYPWPAQLAHDTVESRQVRLWRDWCQGKCKRFISLFPDFFAVKNQCPRTQPGCWYTSHFIFGDVHYTSRGNALVAGAVIKSLEDAPPARVQTKPH